MPKPVLSLGYWRNLRVAAILDGQVRVEGVDLIPSEVHMSELALRQLGRSSSRRGEFDIAELSLSSLLISIDRGDAEYVAIPVFPLRMFFHTLILVAEDAGIDEPYDLIGKRVGIPEYQQTGALWIRHALQHEFGVHPSQMRWWMGRSRSLSHGGVTGFVVPDDVDMQYVPDDDDLASMLLRGEMDAVLLYIRNTLVDRSSADLDRDPRVRPLFPDPAAEGIRYLNRTGIFPINHVLTVRRSLVEQYPWLPQNLYNAFSESKRLGEAQLRRDAQPYVDAGAMTLMRESPFPYGFKANATVLEALRDGSREQGLTSRTIGFDEIFVPELLDL